MKSDNKPMSLWRVTKGVMRMVMACCPVYFLGSAGIGVAMGLFYGAQVLATQFAFDEVTALGMGQGTWLQAAMAIGVFALVKVLSEISEGIYSFQQEVIGKRMHGFISKLVAEKTAKLDPILFEDPRTLDEINKASQATHEAYWIGTTLPHTLIFYVPAFGFLGFYLYSLNPLLLWAIALLFVPKMVAAFIKTPLYAKLEDTSAPLRREQEFYEDAMGGRLYLKETRLLGAYPYFKERCDAVLKQLNREQWRTDAKMATIETALTFLTVLGYIGILYLLFVSLRGGLITVGAFAAVFANVGQLIWTVDGMVVGKFGHASRQVGSISYLLRFFDLPERGGQEEPVNWQGDIVFHNVGFTYPGSKTPSLAAIDLTIKAGETIAIVGENGAGKSTLTKVLTGHFRPTVGRVTVDGKDTATIAPAALFQGVTAVFQKFQKYQLSLGENIQLAEIERNSPVEPTLAQAGVHLTSLDTLLSREFGGVELSGGQWQRVAIARGLYRGHELLVLDEPTAAIDPLEENRLYETFAKLAKDKTAIIVTHRLGSAQIADRIIVMAKGKIAETGTHQQLLKAKGLYANMYQSQEQWYV